MQRQTRIALVIVAAALALGAIAIHRHNATLERSLAADGGAP